MAATITAVALLARFDERPLRFLLRPHVAAGVVVLQAQAMSFRRRAA